MNQRIFLLVLTVAVVKGLPVEKTAKANQTFEGKMNICDSIYTCDYSNIPTAVSRRYIPMIWCVELVHKIYWMKRKSLMIQWSRTRRNTKIQITSWHKVEIAARRVLNQLENKNHFELVQRVDYLFMSLLCSTTRSFFYKSINSIVNVQSRQVMVQEASVHFSVGAKMHGLLLIAITMSCIEYNCSLKSLKAIE